MRPPPRKRRAGAPNQPAHPPKQRAQGAPPQRRHSLWLLRGRRLRVHGLDSQGRLFKRPGAAREEEEGHGEAAMTRPGSPVAVRWQSGRPAVRWQSGIPGVQLSGSLSFSPAVRSPAGRQCGSPGVGRPAGVTHPPRAPPAARARGGAWREGLGASAACRPGRATRHSPPSPPPPPSQLPPPQNAIPPIRRSGTSPCPR